MAVEFGYNASDPGVTDMPSIVWNLAILAKSPRNVKEIDCKTKQLTRMPWT
jgi:hypothetical protein